MHSLKSLFRVGPGPSSSHTIAPSLAAASFFKRIMPKETDRIAVTLYGSLALTGAGHATEKAIEKELIGIPTTFERNLSQQIPHQNYFKFEAYHLDEKLAEASYISVGGGELFSSEDPSVNESDVYSFTNFSALKEAAGDDIKSFCESHEQLHDYLSFIVGKMFETIERGIQADGMIDPPNCPRLKMPKVAKKLYQSALNIKAEDERAEMLISAYAYAVAEENATGREIVTAPTCGSAGVLPAVLYHAYHDQGIPLDKIVDSLYIAGMIGNVIKQNASIAGATGGCQAEIGSASAMAAAALAYCHDLSPHQQEYAAECALEHFLGLTCDPVEGYVIVPCIERNGIGALRAYNAYLFAKHIAPLRQNVVSFDNVVSAMKITGDSLSKDYKETAQGGLADVLGRGRDTNC